MKAMKSAAPSLVKPINEVVTARRATPSFESTPVPDELLQMLLNLALHAPSGYNLQPWRFIIVRSEENRRKLRQAAMDQPKVEEAPVVVIACASTTSWKQDLEEMVALAQQNGQMDEETGAKVKENATRYLASQDILVWATKQVMIAFTHLMLLAESYGLDTAPMEGFYQDRVREAFGIPDDHLVIALLAIGHLKGKDKKFGGRFDMSKLVFEEEFGKGWQS